VGKSREQILEWEARWSAPAGLATLAAIALLIAGAIVSSPINGDGKAEILRSAHEHGSALLAGGLMQALGFALLAAPLVLLFRAAQARSNRVRGQLIGLIVAAPLFFAVATVLNAAATTDAADRFVGGEAKSTLTTPAAAKECRSQRQDKGEKEFGEEFGGGGTSGALAACGEQKVEDDEATNAISEVPLEDAASGFGIGGRLGLAVALLYTCLWAMRVGLLTRFWGSLGMALGVATLLGLVLFLVIWFIYFALLLLGRVPGGRPPAWAAGEAIPWPTPGEKAATSLEASDPEPDPGDGDPPAAANGDSRPGEERRKRKQRE
jgi:hypothetical protein